jgi:hypothetical protein
MWYTFILGGDEMEDGRAFKGGEGRAWAIYLCEPLVAKRLDEWRKKEDFERLKWQKIKTR